MIRFQRGRNALVYPPDRGAMYRRAPMILFLHGMGERGPGGGELCRIARWGLARLRAQGLLHLDVPFPFVLAAPQCPPERTWGDEEVMAALDAMLEEMIASGEADPARLVIAGFSMGGYGAYDAALRWPARFTALVSVCGMCLEPQRLDELAALPQWVAWAEDDEITHLTLGSKEIVERLAKHGRLVARPYRVGALGSDGAHPRTANAAFAEPDLYRWLLARTGQAGALASPYSSLR